MSDPRVASMVRAVLVGIVVLVATAAVAAAALGQPAFDAASLAAGSALELAPAEAPVVVPTPDEAVALDAEMQAFVEPLKAVRDPQRRLPRVDRSEWRSRGMFSLEYAEVTRTARDISTTAKAIACRSRCCSSRSRAPRDCARATRAWRFRRRGRTTARVVIASHVNTAVRTSGGEETVVDFNIRQYEGRQQSRRVERHLRPQPFLHELGRRGAAAQATMRRRSSTCARPPR